MKTSGAACAAFVSLLSGTVLAAGPPSRVPGGGHVGVVDGFKWTNVLDPSRRVHDAYSVACQASAEFPATQYTLHHLFQPQPRGLLSWAESLKTIFGAHRYPGTWGGLDPHGDNRHVLMMEYHHVPVVVREWVEKQHITGGTYKDVFVVYAKAESKAQKIHGPVKFQQDKIDRSEDSKRVMIFAPGAIYDILPLWVAEDSSCSEFLQLDKYSEIPSDGAVVSWVTKHTAPETGKSRHMTFAVRAELLSAKTEQEVAAASAAADAASTAAASASVFAASASFVAAEASAYAASASASADSAAAAYDAAASAYAAADAGTTATEPAADKPEEKADKGKDEL